MQFQVNILMSGIDSDVKVNKIIELNENDEFVVTIEDDEEFAQELTILSDDLELVELKDMVIGTQYKWSYVDDSVYDMEDMTQEDWDKGGYVTRIS